LKIRPFWEVTVTGGYGDSCNNPQTSPDAVVPWGGGRTVDAEALGAVPAGHSIVALSVRCRTDRG
jgi:hypothetical protein